MDNYMKWVISYLNLHNRDAETISKIVEMPTKEVEDFIANKPKDANYAKAPPSRHRKGK